MRNLVGTIAVLLLVSFLMVAGCGKVQSPAPSQPPNPMNNLTQTNPGGNTVPPSPPPEGPQGVAGNKQATIMVEGQPKQITMDLLNGAPVPFYTYVPSDMAAQHRNSGAGDEYKIVANFTGKAQPDAYMTIFVYPANMTIEQAVTTAEKHIKDNNWQTKPQDGSDKRYTWSQREWSYEYKKDNKSYTGRIIVAAHRDRPLQIITHYPAEMGDGFVPRAEAVLNEFFWTDTNSKLTQNQ